MPDIRPTVSGNNLLLRNINSLKRGYSGSDSALPKMYGGNKFKMPRHNSCVPNNGTNHHGGGGGMQISAVSSANQHQHRISQQQQQQHLLRQQVPHQSSDKFNAFGMFLTSSLLDMPENKALGLIEKFTNEIVRALIDKTSTLTSGDEIANTPASATTAEENNV